MVEIERVRDDLIFVMPSFIHEIGDRHHHMSMVRTCDRDEEGDLVPGTGPSDLRFWLHEWLDDWIFYPIRDWLKKWVGDNGVYSVLRALLGFAWGLNCGFPPRDVALYTVWDLRGCRALAVYERVDSSWRLKP